MSFQDKLTAQFRILADEDYSDAILEGAQVLLRAAKPNSPVDTGLMKSKHEARKTGKNEAVFEVDTDYAVIVEYRQPWIRPAIDRSGRRIINAVGKRVEGDMKHAI